jgi:hypothetical protein
MTSQRVLAVALIVALLVTALPAPAAEAVEPTTLILLVSAGVVVIILVAYLIVANVQDSRRATEEGGPTMIVLVPRPAESQ